MMRTRLPVQQQPQQIVEQPMGQLGDLASSAGPFIFGMVTWAFFGETIKGVLGLGTAVAGKGITAAHKKLK